MKIVEIQKNNDSWHNNQTSLNYIVEFVPEGWAVIPDKMETPNFPYGDLTAEEVNGVMTVTSWTAGELPPPDTTGIRAAKETEISTACNTAITAGTDVDTTQGTEHFSLEETDQINLSTALAAVQAGTASYPYHADGQLCRMFTADEIVKIANAATAHKLYHTTLCNHILTWVRRAETAEEIESITYNAEALPADLAANMAAILMEASVI